MKIREIRDYLDSRFPTSLSEEWDNDGAMLCLNDEGEVKGVLTTLDVTDEVVDRALEVGANLIVSHHPLIFKPLKRLDGTPLSKRIERLIKNDVTVLSYHTRFDSADGGMNDTLADLLGLKNVETFGFESGIAMGRIGDVEEQTPEQLAAEVSVKLGVNVLFVSGKRSVRRLALLGGGGKDFIHLAQTLGADAMITGDISYSVINEELPFGITMIDAGHFGTEKHSARVFADIIKEKFDVEVESFTGENPIKIMPFEELAL